jgi:hypothetical protein
MVPVQLGCSTFKISVKCSGHPCKGINTIISTSRYHSLFRTTQVMRNVAELGLMQLITINMTAMKGALLVALLIAASSVEK